MGWRRRMGMGLTLGLGGIALLILTAFLPHPGGERPAGSCDLTLYVGGDRVHTHVIVPMAVTLGSRSLDWREQVDLSGLGGSDQDLYGYLAFGWGDRAFYLSTPTWGDLGLSTTLRALLWPTDTVLYVQHYAGLPQSTQTYRLKPIQVSWPGYLQLAQWILQSFARDPQGQVMPIQADPRYSGRFYRATGRYWMVQTCNDWTGQALRRASIQTPLWSGVAPALWRHLRDGCEAVDPLHPTP